jgi:hypothetical protein
MFFHFKIQPMIGLEFETPVFLSILGSCQCRGARGDVATAKGDRGEEDEGVGDHQGAARTSPGK